MRIVGTYSLAVLLLFSCAQRAVLTGGEKDVLPPKIENSTPQNKSTLFNSKEIIIEFDEFIKLSNLSSQLIVSPPLKTTPDVVVKGKKLIVTLEDELEANTTYTINFGDAVSDITEANIYSNFCYVFSTGNHVDSLAFSGAVINAFDASFASQVFVMLYKQNIDSVPFLKIPDFMAKTASDGSFQISNISQGTYKVFVLNDINSNFIYDLPNESIGFLDEPVVLDSTVGDSKLFLFSEEKDVQFVKKIENPVFGNFKIEFNSPVKSLEITDALNQVVQIISRDSSPNKTNFSVWINTESKEENQQFFISDNGKVIDTAEVELVPMKDTLLTFSNKHAGVLDLNSKIELFANYPIDSIEQNQVFLYQDSVSIPFQLNIDSINKQKISIDAGFKENKKYQLLFLPNSFNSIFDLKNDSVFVQLKTKKERDYGKLILTVQPSFNEKYIVQFYQKENQLKEFFLEGNQLLEIPYLAPGSYKIKLIIDSNNNNVWDSGNYLKKIQPERVILYNEDITIRENWDNEILWKVSN